MRRLIVILLLPFLLAGCAGLEGPRGADSTVVRFGFSGAAYPETKGAASPGEYAIETISVFFYEDGVLRPDLSMESNVDGASEFSLEHTLIIGRTLEVFAIANVPFPVPPATRDEAMALRYACAGPGEWASGLPMAGHSTFKVRYSSPEVTVDLERLVAKLCLTVDTSQMEHGSIEFTSVAVRQMNATCLYFDCSSASSAADVMDGDYATPEEIARLNTEGRTFVMPFYMLENQQGDLLAGNTDPNNKTPDSVEAAGGDPCTCTYIEVTGNYRDRSGHLIGEPLYARFFPGEDACGNFDVVRNSIYRVTMIVTDRGCLRADWKLESNITDTRTLNFLSSNVNLEQGKSTFLRLDTNLSLAQGDYSYNIGGASSNFDFTEEEGGVRVIAHENARKGSVLNVTAKTWDGALVTSCQVTAKESYASKFIVECDGDIYVAQSGRVRIRAKNGSDMSGRTSLLSTGVVFRTRGSGEYWYYDAYEGGSGTMTLSVDGIQIAVLKINALVPKFGWPASEIVLPLDGTPVDVGPFFVDVVGNRMYPSDFNPDLYASRLGFSITRQVRSDMRGRYWPVADDGSNRAIEVADTGTNGHFYVFRLATTTVNGYDIHQNYDFSVGHVKLESVTARINISLTGIGTSTATICTEDP